MEPGTAVAITPEGRDCRNMKRKEGKNLLFLLNQVCWRLLQVYGDLHRDLKFFIEVRNRERPQSHPRREDH